MKAKASMKSRRANRTKSSTRVQSNAPKKGSAKIIIASKQPKAKAKKTENEKLSNDKDLLNFYQQSIYYHPLKEIYFECHKPEVNNTFYKAIELTRSGTMGNNYLREIRSLIDSGLHNQAETTVEFFLIEFNKYIEEESEHYENLIEINEKNKSLPIKDIPSPRLPVSAHPTQKNNRITRSNSIYNQQLKGLSELQAWLNNKYTKPDGQLIKNESDLQEIREAAKSVMGLFFDSEVTIAAFIEVFRGKKNLKLKTTNTRLLSYFLNQLCFKLYIVSIWKNICAKNNSFISRSDKPLLSRDFSVAISQQEITDTSSHREIDDALKKLPNKAKLNH